jgi:hypothetical protein
MGQIESEVIVANVNSSSVPKNVLGAVEQRCKPERMNIPTLVDKEVDHIDHVQHGYNDHGVGHVAVLLVL